MVERLPAAVKTQDLDFDAPCACLLELLKCSRLKSELLCNILHQAGEHFLKIP